MPQPLIGMKIVVRKPDYLSGRVGYITGERFKYPSQDFWVIPVIIDGENNLIVEFEEYVPHEKYRSLDDPWMC